MDLCDRKQCAHAFPVVRIQVEQLGLTMLDGRIGQIDELGDDYDDEDAYSDDDDLEGDIVEEDDDEDLDEDDEDEDY